ncbi:MAG: class I SAM-dependent methyltransferase [Caldilineaceae bacterium]|nr:class I SAM-dependent methyltransferase [Caldilineaceae bacterium]
MKLLPHTLKKRFAQQPYYQSYYYAKRAAAVYLSQFSAESIARHSADSTPLVAGVSEVEALFATSAANFEATISPFVSEFSWFLGRIHNKWFGTVEIELYYSMIRCFQPERIVEIGSGHSTYFAVEALKKNGTGEIFCVDPQPRRSLPDEVQYIQSMVEDVELDFFAQLKEHDILFIDSSHTTEEAEYHCEQILPLLAPGVIVHHHDFAFPYDIYYLDDPERLQNPMCCWTTTRIINRSMRRSSARPMCASSNQT